MLPLRGSRAAATLSAADDDRLIDESPAAAYQWIERRMRDRRAAVAPANSAGPAGESELAEKIAALEARAEEQEAALRRVLTLLVEWVEGGAPEPAYRTHAA